MKNGLENTCQKIAPGVIYGTPHTCLEGVQKATKFIGQDKQCPSQTKNEHQLIKSEAGTPGEKIFLEWCKGTLLANCH